MREKSKRDLLLEIMDKLELDDKNRWDEGDSDE